MERPPLSPEQLLAFKAEGVVVCRGLVPKSTTARWREQIWSTLEADPDDPSTYAAAQGHPRLRGAGSEARPVASPALCELSQVQAIVEQLCDDKMKNVSVRRPLCAHDDVGLTDALPGTLGCSRTRS